jgi:predicted DsbA family dithiol-disulfide isomerase
LQKAASEAESKFGKTVSVTHTPFILRPEFPKEGVDKLSMFTQMFGSEIAARRKLEQIQSAAQADGLPFVLGQKAGNSLDAHRLLAWARSQEKESALLEEIYRVYNCEAKWVGDHEALVEAAGRAGLDANAAKEFLANESAGVDEVKAGLERSRQLAVQGVPAFFVNGQFVGSGAQPSEVFASLFQKAESV